MDPRENEPFDREPWRKLLGAESRGPAGEIERRILDEARRAVAPRVTRWLLPASLAASVLIAVLIVQWQFAGSGAPAHVTESDVISVPASGAAEESAPFIMMELPVVRRDKSPAPPPNVPPPMIDLPQVETPSTPAAAAPVAARAITATGQRKQEPESESERMPDSRFAADGAAMAQPAPTTAPAPAPAPVQAESHGAPGNLYSKESDAKLHTPEEWYAEIEALRAAGKSREADEELARLKTAYPGWLEQHNRQKP